MRHLAFDLPDGTRHRVQVAHLLNAGYSGRRQDEVQAHIAELAALGVAKPTTTPALYPIAPYLAMQTSAIDVQHARTSGEAEWALVVTEEATLLTVACDHTDRTLEVHGVAWSKNAAPDVLGNEAWYLDDVRDQLDRISLRAWVTHGQQDPVMIQDSTLASLLTPDHWLSVLDQRGLNAPGTVLASGTVPMVPSVDQFAPEWHVAMTDPVTGRTISLNYRARVMPEPIG